MRLFNLFFRQRGHRDRQSETWVTKITHVGFSEELEGSNIGRDNWFRSKYSELMARTQ